MQHETIQEYYGQKLQTSADLQTNACCTPDSMPDWLKAILAKMHDEVLSRYYGCGLIAPEALDGARVLDLGSGSGRDVFALSALVGDAGEVVGVDMTTEQLEVARRHQEFHRDAFGLSRVNTSFYEGFIEKLADLGLASGSFDVVISNCVINLAQDKGAVLKGVYDLLKPGGEMYFSDVYADRRIPAELASDEVLYGECLSGALYWNDFLRLAREAGFADPRVVEQRPLTIENPVLEAKVAPIGFSSKTVRLFKIDTLEPSAEDYGQAVIYKGGIETAERQFRLDGEHAFEVGRAELVCGNTWRMLEQSRFAPHFQFAGDFSRHFGAFEGSVSKDTTPLAAVASDPAPKTSSGCCG